MTEAEWLKSNDVTAMVEYLKHKAVATPRKLFLFSCACLRRVMVDQPPVLDLIEVAERFVEDPVTNEERRSAVANLDATQDLRSLTVNLVRHCLTATLAGVGAEMDLWHQAMATAACAKAAPETASRGAALLRDIFLTPLIRRLPRIPPSWLTATVKQLAQAIYEERAFDRLPILADALEDAGCDNADILNHCRQPGVHVRGCWVVDLVLGKE
jgi:hypothetical protein